MNSALFVRRCIVFVSDDSASNRQKLKVCSNPCRSVLRTKRRFSVAPLPSLRLNDKEMLANEFDGQSVISNQNSLTSVNSLASLLKEKMQVCDVT